jgi:hypothetical protein
MRKYGLVIVAAMLVALVACKKSEVGGECSSRDDCVNRNDCVKDSNGKGQCTISCLAPTPGSKDECPSPTTCQGVAMSIQVPDKTVNVPNVYRCLRP